MDYSKWDRLSREVEADEEQQKQKEREERKLRYEKEQELKRIQYKEKYGCEPPAPSCCGFASPDQIEAAKQQSKSKKHHTHGKDCSSHHQEKESEPQLNLKEKNEKKKLAALAAKEDGNRFFKEGKYDTAFAIYERGALIINGMYGMSDAEYDEMFDLEKVLDLNMAACRLKQENYLDAISHCRMALNLDKDCVKAHYRMGQAYVALGELDKARSSFEKAESLSPSDVSIKKHLSSIDLKLQEQTLKELEFQKQFGNNLIRS